MSFVTPTSTKDTLHAELKRSTLLKPGFVELEHTIANTSIAFVKNPSVVIPDDIHQGMNKRIIKLAQDLQRQREMRLATRPTLEEIRLRRTIIQKLMSNVDQADLTKFNNLVGTRNSYLRVAHGDIPIKYSPPPITQPPSRDTTNDLMMWWGQNWVISSSEYSSSFSSEPDGLHLAAEVEAHDGSAHDSSLTVVGQFFLDGDRIFPKRTSGVSQYASTPSVEYYGAVWAFTTAGGSLPFSFDFGDHWAKLYLNSTQKVFINSDQRAINNEAHPIIAFVNDEDSGWSVLPGPYNMPQVTFDANQLDFIEIDLILSLDFIVEGNHSVVTVGRRNLFDYALLLLPQWKIVQIGG